MPGFGDPRLVDDAKFESTMLESGTLDEKSLAVCRATRDEARQHGVELRLAQIAIQRGPDARPDPSSRAHGGSRADQPTRAAEMMEKQQLVITDAVQSTRAEMEAQLSKAEAENAELKAKAEVQVKAELKAANAELKAERARLTARAISDEQLTAVQSRLETMHVAELLTDDELFALEVSKSTR